jgi:ABC-type multidrug transport system fused ATPase/permease subunit
VTTCIASIVYALTYGPSFAIICVLYLPILLGTVTVFGLRFRKMTTEKLNVIKHLGGITEESLTAIKVVAGFG